MTEYKIFYDDRASELSKIVTEAMQEGWQPLGGVAAWAFALPPGEEDSYELRYVQAMVR